MNKVVAIPFQFIAYAAFATCVAWFATRPVYHYGDAQMSEVKLSLSHATDRVAPCVQLTQEQIAELAANMRRSEVCERERLPLILELDIDGERVVEMTAMPSGMWNDGPASVYERLLVSPGVHEVSVRLRDTDRVNGWDYSKSENVELKPGRYFTITFKAETGGFQFR